MTVDEGENKLRQLLLEAGFDFSHPDPALAWKVFKSFATEPVESDGEELFFEAGDGDPVKGFPGYFDFVRQFRHYPDDGVVWDEQITAHFTCPPNVKLGLRGYLQADQFANLSAFFRAVEASSAFRTGIAYPGWCFEVRLDGC
jgi:hypothetical protein